MILIAYARRMAADEKWKPIESIDETGATVARNIKRIRGRMPYTELADKLEELKRPIPTLGLRKIESGGRRVDADDLMALALALGVSPATLLMPITEADDTSVTATGVDGAVEARRLWRWLVPEFPLTGDTADAVFSFYLRAIPSWLLGRDIDLVESGIEPNITRILRRYGSEQLLRERADGDDQ